MRRRVDRAIDTVRVGGGTVLDLSGRQLRRSGSRSAVLTTVTSLNLSGCHLGALPDWLGELTALTELRLDDNQFSELPGSIGEPHQTHRAAPVRQPARRAAGVGCELTNLARLDLSGTQLATQSASIGGLTGLDRRYPTQAVAPVV